MTNETKRKFVEYEVLNYDHIESLKEIIEADDTIYDPEDIKKFIDGNNNIGFIVKLDGKIIGLAYGYILLHLDSTLKMYVYSVDILKSHQNLGFGTNLMKFIVEYGKAQGYYECYLSVNKNNINARRAYVKSGLVCGDDSVEYSIIY